MINPDLINDALNKVTVMMRTMTKSETEFKLDFVPVIFANGEDDDGPGLTAALTNQRVQFMDKIYQPNQDMILINCKFALTVPINLVDPVSGRTMKFEDINIPGFTFVTKLGRVVLIQYCLVRQIVAPRM